MSLIIGEDTVSGIRKPDMAVRMDNCVVWGIEAFALKVVYEDGNRSVILSSCDAPRAVFTTDESTLPIAGVPVCIIGGFAIGAYLTRSLLPFQDTVIRNVTQSRNPPSPNQTGPSDQRAPVHKRSTTALPILYFAKRGSITSTAGSG